MQLAASNGQYLHVYLLVLVFVMTSFQIDCVLFASR